MKFAQAKHFYSGGNVPKLIVIHDMEYPESPTGAQWCADFFAGANAPQASAHYCVDSNTVIQCVRDTDGAWHTPGSLDKMEINRQSIGIEHAGYASQSREQWQDTYSTAELELSAILVASLCTKYAIPAVRLTVEELRAGARGLCGHVDCTVASGSGSHTDPGPNFPWDWYLERVRTHMLMTPTATASTLPTDGWPVVECDGMKWQVAPLYLPFVGIGQAASLAEQLGCELPSPELVDAIWRAADLRIDANKMVFTAAEGNDGTPQTMASAKTFEYVTTILETLIGERSLGVDFHLLAGAFKDVVRKDGAVGIYGWQRPDGTNIQPFYDKHAMGWIDYSQGLRLVRRAVG